MKLLLNFKNILIIFFIIGLYLIVTAWARSSNVCSGPKIVYKYIPRDFTTDNNYPDNVSLTFKDMFREPTPYIAPLGNNNLRVLV
jgi:hypothetical protein